ncbi:MAG: GTP-binding protein [Candidatus Tritonobacter lacicola]|nr:GTP-binding protein [Candidatus Tritonobacter lacicola]
MGKRESMKIVIVGHVDHGKSTLIGRLLYDTGSLPPDRMEVIRKTCEEMGMPVEFAFVMDHLREERERGITIDTAQTFFNTPSRDYVIIDAPGHKEFMKNMITGASQAETSILVIDVDEGVQEQTKRHAYILGMLNLKKNILVMNKMDLVDYSRERFEEVRDEVTAFLKRLDITPSYIVPAVGTLGENFAKKSDKIPWYDGPTVFGALDALEKDKDISEKPLRMPVQDVYEVEGKRIIAGRIESGKLKDGEELVLLPEDIKVKITGVLEFNRERHSAEACESIGITISDDGTAKRGDLLSDPGNRPRTGKKIIATLFWMSPQAFDIGEKLTFRANTQETPCTVKEIMRRIDSSTLDVIEDNARVLKENEVGEILIECEKPVSFELFRFIPELGRFVLERGNDIVAGGIITHSL